MKYLRVFTNSLGRRSGAGWRPALLFVGVMLLASLLAATALASAQKAPLAYVTQRDAQPEEADLCSVPGSVSAIDTTDNRVVATVEVGPGPHGMAISSNGKKGYVANYGTFPSKFAQATCLSDTVSVLKLDPRNPDKDADGKAANRPKVVATVKVGAGPLGVAITPDDEEVYVTNFGRDPNLVEGGIPGNTVSVIQTRSNEVVTTISLEIDEKVGNLPAGVAIAPDGRHAYVTSRGNNNVWVLDTATHTVVTTIDVQIEPANVVFTPDGRRAYVANFGSNSVSVIDTATNTVMPVPDGEAIKVGVVPIGLAVTPDGTRVYVVNVNFSPVPPFPPGNVSVIDTDPSSPTFNTVVDTVVVGQGPRAVAITPDGALAYVTNFVDDTISVIETATNKVVDTIDRVTGGPNWVTITDRHGKGQKKHD